MSGLNQNRPWKCALQAAAVFTVVTFTGAASTATAGSVFSTDRLGYTGTVVRYLTETDAQSAVNAQETVAIGVDVALDDSREHRDASFYFVDNAPAYDTDYNVLLGSWWYSTTSGSGNGNINGNTGIGFMQLYDEDGSTDTSLTMDFSNFNGTYWQDFTLSAEGANLDPNSRLSVYDNVQDGGTWLEYALNVTVSGLQGLQTGSEIVANNHPTSVTGGFTGLFQMGGDPDGNPNTDFYTVTLNFDMENWAYANNGSLTGPYQQGGNIYDSLFVATVPVPATVWLFGSALGMLQLLRRRPA